MSSQVARTAYLYGAGTVSTTALALTDAPFSFSVANIALADEALITATTAGLRYRIDGAGNPTATSHLIATGATVSIIGNTNIQNLRLIRDGGSDASAAVTLLRY
jgi:hypothetical protein